MNLTENKIDELNVELTIDVASEDYEAARKKRLSDRRKTAELKGFRKGNVPMSLIERVYGDQALVDAVNEIVSSQLNDYIKSSKMNFIGEPLSGKNQKEVEWGAGKDFTFVFDLGAAPEVKLELAKEDVVPYYNINITETAKKEMKANLRKIDESKKDATDEELEDEVVKTLEQNYKMEADYRLSKDIRDYLIEKAAIALPEDFLKRWVIAENDGKYSEEDVEKDFPAFLSDFRWQMIRDYIFAKNDFKITEQDMKEAAEAYVAYQYAMYGMANVPEEIIKESAQNVLANEKQVRRIEEQVVDQKVMAAIKDTITTKSKKISLDKFRELK